MEAATKPRGLLDQGVAIGACHSATREPLNGDAEYEHRVSQFVQTRQQALLDDTLGVVGLTNPKVERVPIHWEKLKPDHGGTPPLVLPEQYRGQRCPALGEGLGRNQQFHRVR